MAAAKWTDVVASEKYKALSEAGKAELKNRYWTKVVATSPQYGSLDEKGRADLRNRFYGTAEAGAVADGSAVNGGATEPDAPEGRGIVAGVKDAFLTAGQTANSVAQSIYTLPKFAGLGANWVFRDLGIRDQKEYEKAAADIERAYAPVESQFSGARKQGDKFKSPQQQAQLKAIDDAVESKDVAAVFSALADNPVGTIDLAAQSIGDTLVGGFAGKQAFARKMQMLEGVIGKEAAQKAATQAAVATGTSVEALQSAVHASSGGAEQIAQLDDAKLSEQSGRFRELISGGVPSQTAREILAAEYDLASGAASGTGTMIGGLAFRPVEHVIKVLGGGAGAEAAKKAALPGITNKAKALVGEAPTAALSEAGQEASQSFSEQVGGNIAAQGTIDENRGTFDGAGTAAALGGVLGGVTGGGLQLAGNAAGIATGNAGAAPADQGGSDFSGAPTEELQRAAADLAANPGSEWDAQTLNEINAEIERRGEQPAAAAAPTQAAPAAPEQPVVVRAADPHPEVAIPPAPGLGGIAERAHATVAEQPLEHGSVNPLTGEIVDNLPALNDTQLVEEVRGLMAENDPPTAKEIAEKFGVDRERAGRALQAAWAVQRQQPAQSAPPTAAEVAPQAPPVANQAESAWSDWYHQNRSSLGDELFIGGHADRSAYANLPEDMQDRSAHGMAKNRADGLQALRDILSNGIDPTRGRGGQSGTGGLDTAPLASRSAASAAGVGTASGSAYTDGPFTLVARPGVAQIRNISEVEAVVVNSAVPDAVVAGLRAEFPGMKFMRAGELASLSSPKSDVAATPAGKEFPTMHMAKQALAASGQGETHRVVGKGSKFVIEPKPAAPGQAAPAEAGSEAAAAPAIEAPAAVDSAQDPVALAKSALDAHRKQKPKTKEQRTAWATTDKALVAAVKAAKAGAKPAAESAQSPDAPATADPAEAEVRAKKRAALDRAKPVLTGDEIADIEQEAMDKADNMIDFWRIGADMLNEAVDKKEGVTAEQRQGDRRTEQQAVEKDSRNGDRRMMSGDDLVRASVEGELAAAGMTDAQVKTAQDVIAERLTDGVTGWTDAQKGNTKAEAMAEAERTARASGDPVHYVSMDIANLGGLNAFHNDVSSEANKDYRFFTDTIRGELEAVSSGSMFLRTGGDEFGAFVQGIGAKQINDAMLKAKAKIRAYAESRGFADLPHKKAGKPAGVTVYWGLGEVRIGDTSARAYDEADAKLKTAGQEASNVSEVRNEAPGALDERPGDRGGQPDREQDAGRAGDQGGQGGSAAVRGSAEGSAEQDGRVNPGTVSVPKEVSEALEGQIAKQKARVGRFDKESKRDNIALADKTSTLTKLKAAEATLRTMRRDIFVAEDLALQVIRDSDITVFEKDMAALFPEAHKVLQQIISKDLLKKSVEKAKADQGGSADANIGRKWNSQRGEVEIIGRSGDSYRTTLNGNQIGADFIPVADLERVIKVDENWYQHKLDSERRAADEKAKKQADSAAKDAEYSDIGSPEGELPMQRARRVALLSNMVRYNGEVMTSKQLVEKLVDSGAKTGTFEEDKIKPMSRRAFNRADGREQAAHAAKVKAGGKVTRYQIGDTVVSKTEFDYANHLIGKRAGSAQESEQQSKRDPRKGQPKSELGGFKVGDRVSVDGRTIGESVITELFTQEMAGGSVDIAKIRSIESGKELEVNIVILAKVQKDEKPQQPANTIVTDARAAELRERLKKKLNGGQVNAGLDPEILAIGAEMAVYHIERGARRFAAFSKAIANDLDMSVSSLRKYLRGWYNGARDLMEDGGQDVSGMDSADEVRAALADIPSEDVEDSAPSANTDSADMAQEQDNATRELDSAGAPALAGAPAEGVQGAEGERQPGQDAGGSGGSNGERPANAEGGRVRPRSGVGNGEGAPPISAGGKRGKRAGTPQPSLFDGEGNQPNDVQSANAGRVEPPQFSPEDFTIGSDLELGEGGDKTKFKRNVDAIRLLKQLETEGRHATPEEQRVLALYVGWGGLAGAFDASNQKWSKEHAELREILDDEEYDAARESTQYAHYTSREIIQGIYGALHRLGFSGGKVLEAGGGVGNFIGLMPEEMRTAGRFTLVEREKIASGIAKYLYPNQNVQFADFTSFGRGDDGRFDAQIGNPPFSRTSLTDRSGRKHLSGLRIHNYFIAKGIDMLRDGGLQAVVVSNGFMDSKDDRARRYIGERARFLGAVRLPNNAFSKNAGTEVTTDIVFFQKLPESQWGSAEAKRDMQRWLGTSEVADRKGGAKIKTNRYFADNPKMMLGEWTKAGTMYGPDQPALIARPGQNTALMMAAALMDLPAGVYQSASIANTSKAIDGAIEALHDHTISEGGHYKHNGKLWQRLPDVAGEKRSRELTPDTQWTEKTKLGDTGFRRIKGMAAIRKTLRELIAAEMRGDEAMTDLRAKLNEQYDTYVAAQGLLNDSTSARYFIDDPDYPLLAALEFKYTPGLGASAAKSQGVKPFKSTAEKAPIMSRRVIEDRKTVEKADSPADAINISMAERGHIDEEYIATLLGRDSEGVLEDLASGSSPLLFKDPATNEFVLRDAYLSGNVRKKLAQAKQSGLVTNALELEKVLPKDVGAGQITARIGAPWVPAKVYEDFAKHLLGSGTKASITYIPLNSSFAASIEAESDVSDRTTHGTREYPASKLLIALLNNREIKVTYTDKDGKTITLKDETEAAQDKAREIKDKFQDWLFSDGDRGEMLVRSYNDANNNYVARKYDGSWLTFPGKVPDSVIKFRKHQRDFVARVMQDRTSLADHVVGAGKTFSAVAAAVELKRTGLARKPMVAVPNHLVKQWAADFYRLYPGAKILTATKKDFDRQNRRRFLARIATGDWDAVVIAHSSFGFIKPSAEFEEAFNKKQIASIVATIESLDKSDGDAKNKKRTIKQLEAMKERLENRIAKLRDKPVDDLLDFEQIGVDQLFVDEAHMFKNLMFSTKMQSIRGLGDPAGSQRAYDMFLKINEVYEKNGRNQGVVFLTGTPVSNSLAEMYHMMRYLMPDALESSGFGSFDAWANTFASIEETLKPKTSGDGYKTVTAFGNFSNVPELLAMFDQVSDTVTMEDIKAAFKEENNGKEFPLPKLATGRRQPVALEKSERQSSYMEQIAERAKELEQRKGPPKKGEDNHLSLMGDARKVAMDIRLVDHSVIEREKGARIDRAADEVHARYLKWSEQRGTQLVFSDLGTPIKHAKKELVEYQALQDRIAAGSSDEVIARANLEDAEAMEKVADAEDAQEELDAKGQDWLDAIRAAERGFSVYDDMRSALIERGIPENEIAFIHDYNTDDQKAALFRKVNSGEIRVVLGSTAKMGAGTNVQERLVALHHLDIPWRPSDVEQREGRIIRQGNKLSDEIPGFEVEILAYVTKDTLDKNMWDIQERKLRGINALRSRQIERDIENSFDDMEMSASEMQAAATGNVDLLKEIQLKNEIQKLERKRRGFDAQKADLVSRRKNAEKKIASIPEMIGKYEVVSKSANEYERSLEKTAKAFSVTINGKDYTSRSEAAQAARALVDATYFDEESKTNKAVPLDVTMNGEQYGGRQKFTEAFLDIAGDASPVAWEFDGKTINRRASAEKAIMQSVADVMADGGSAGVGRIGGFSVVIENEGAEESGRVEISIEVKTDGAEAIYASSWENKLEKPEKAARNAAEQIVKSAINLIGNAPATLAYYKDSLARAKTELADANAAGDLGEWPDQAKLDDLRAKHKQVIERIKSGASKKKQTVSTSAVDTSSVSADEFGTGEAVDSTDSAYPMFSRKDTVKRGMKSSDVTRIIDGMRAGGARIAVRQSAKKLPKPILDEAAKQGISLQDIRGVHYAGTSYLVADNLTKSDVQSVVFHEAYVHGGLRARYEGRVESRMIDLAHRLSGKGKPSEKVMRLAEKQGIDLSDYVRGLNNDSTKTNRQKLAILTEELLAHMGETTGSLRAYLEEIAGFIRQFLRKAGLAELSGVSVSDLRYELRAARNAYMAAQAGEARTVPMFGIAYHGTPHTVDRFRLDRIGTGEGAQAYGWGLYFAGKKEIADWYKELLSGPQFNYVLGGKPVDPPSSGSWKVAGQQLTPEQYAVIKAEFEGGPDAALEKVRGLSEGSELLTKAVRILERMASEPGYMVRTKNEKSGNVYQVEIPDDEHLLQWDEPVPEEILRKIAEKSVEDGIVDADADEAFDMLVDEYDRSGEILYRGLSEQLGGDRQASEFLGSIGLKGLKYLDGTSRTEREGTYNYVIWDEDAISDVQPMFSRRPAASAQTSSHQNIRQLIRSQIALRLKTDRTYNMLWHRGVGTQYHKATVDSHYKRVFDIGQDYLSGIARNAADSMDAAPTLLGRMDGFKDWWRDIKSVATSSQDKADMAAIAKPVFDGTLKDKKQYDDSELAKRFGLNDRQIALYREFHGAVAVSLDALAKAEIFDRLKARKVLDEQTLIAARDMDTDLASFHKFLKNAMEKKRLLLKKQQKAMEAAGDEDGLAMIEKELSNITSGKAAANAVVQRIDQLINEGYAPLMRFGEYTVTVRDPDGAVAHFSMHEKQSEANAAKLQLEKSVPPSYSVESGVMAQGENELFQGISPETIALFGEATGVTNDEIFQQYLKKAVANRSALKRLIHRKEIAGFDKDVQRVLAAFVTSNARRAAKLEYLGHLDEAIEAIPQRKGDVKTEAIRFRKYMLDVGNEAQKFRSALFTFYIAGSIASAAVNLTQPITMTYPYLAQWGAGRAAKEIAKATKDAARSFGADGKVPADIDAAYQKAKRAGVVDPQNIFNMMAMAEGSLTADGAASRSLKALNHALAIAFSQAEALNRKSSFIAAYRIGRDLSKAQLAKANVANAYEFAIKAVSETQGVYNRGNRPNIGRGPVGATVMTFKQFSVSYVEFLRRLWKDDKIAFLIALGILQALAGMMGLPFADDIEDVIGTAMSWAGFGENPESKIREIAQQALGDTAGEFMIYGSSAVLPIDVHGRLGMGNLLPATGVANRYNTPAQQTRELLEIPGVAGGLVQTVLKGEPLPVFAKNAAKGAEMIATGEYRDTKGRKVMDATLGEGIGKMLGFQPSSVARESRALGAETERIGAQRTMEAEFADRRAQAVVDSDREALKKVLNDIKEWNERNPQQRIVITGAQISRRVRELKRTREERFLKRVPKEMRNQVRERMDQ